MTNEERAADLEGQLVYARRPDRIAYLKAEIKRLRGETTTAEPETERAVQPAVRKRTVKPKE